ncbi:hypothetical protein [Amycolatopsis orientalis]|uniref:hypothetical protein n=1 Tax=Amycolatopsis orientalis TaxID=31958 RepID=UPI001319F085|nr:hypothetical protein [Amycolatopsis orientalis]
MIEKRSKETYGRSPDSSGETYEIEVCWFGFNGRDWSYVTAVNGGSEGTRVACLAVPNAELRDMARWILENIPEGAK